MKTFFLNIRYTNILNNACKRNELLRLKKNLFERNS